MKYRIRCAGRNCWIVDKKVLLLFWWDHYIGGFHSKDQAIEWIEKRRLEEEFIKQNPPQEYP